MHQLIKNAVHTVILHHPLSLPLHAAAASAAAASAVKRLPKAGEIFGLSRQCIWGKIHVPVYDASKEVNAYWFPRPFVLVP
jgi:hypothetical protein